MSLHIVETRNCLIMDVLKFYGIQRSGYMHHLYVL